MAEDTYSQMLPCLFREWLTFAHPRTRYSRLSGQNFATTAGALASTLAKARCEAFLPSSVTATLLSAELSCSTSRLTFIRNSMISCKV